MSTINLKKAKKILMVLSIFSFLSAKSQSSCPCPGEIIEQSDFERYISNYRENFLNEPQGKNHTEWIYLPKNYFVFLDNFLKLTPSSDGVWIYFISHDRVIDINQQSGKNQLLINIVASENKKPKLEILKAYFNVSPILNSNNKIHLSTHRNFDLSLFGPKNIFNFTQDQVLENSYRYKQAYSKPGEALDKKYSERLHICREHIEQIKNSLEENKNWGGVKMYFGSYNKKIACTMNDDEKQFTLLLLPVKNQNSNGNFDIYNTFLKEKLRKKLTTSEIYNHGALCPQQCNQ
jgi:hypothetical protein